LTDESHHQLKPHTHTHSHCHTHTQVKMVSTRRSASNLSETEDGAAATAAVAKVAAEKANSTPAKTAKVTPKDTKMATIDEDVTSKATRSSSKAAKAAATAPATDTTEDNDDNQPVANAKGKSKKGKAVEQPKLVPTTGKMHKKFDEEDGDDNSNDDNEIEIPAVKSKKPAVKQAEPENESPDVVQSSHESIQFLKSLHENMIESIARKSSKKRKSSKQSLETDDADNKKARTAAVDADEELDASVFDVFESNIAEQIEDENRQLQKKKKRNLVIDGRPEDNEFSVDKFSRKSKKM
jgi:hypothetical protein